jgi:hypothetical protein
MTDYAKDIEQLQAMANDLRSIRERTCEPKNNSNPRYHALSLAVSSIDKATDHMRAEDAR